MLGMFTSNTHDIDAPLVIEEARHGLANFGWQDLAWSLLVIAVAVAAGSLVARLSLRLIRGWARRTTTRVDDIVTANIAAPLRWLVPVIGVRLALPAISVPSSWREAVGHGMSVAVIVLVGWSLSRGIRIGGELISAGYDTRVEDNLRARAVQTRVRVLGNIGHVIVIGFTIALALTTFESVRQLGTGLLASAGVAGIVIGLAAQRSIGAVLAGLQLALAQPIRVDDVVVVEGQWGRVEEIALTYVVVRIWDLRRLVLPATHFLEKPFENWTRVSSDLLGTVELRLDYTVSVDELRGELKRIVEGSSNWDGKLCSIAVVDASDRTMTVRPLVSAADSGKLWDLRCEVREKLLHFVKERHPGALPRLRATTDA